MSTIQYAKIRFRQLLRSKQRGEEKVFCIGLNKTGTTSLDRLFFYLGLKTANQSKSELLVGPWKQGNTQAIIKFCESADTFQDIPFNLPGMYRLLDKAFPEASFILTVRDSADQWYESITRFHTKILKKNRLPTPQDLQNFHYRTKGYIWEIQQIRYGATEQTLYNKEVYQNYYENYQREVKEYFAHRPEKLLVLNVSQPSAVQKVCDFLHIPYTGIAMPHINKTRDPAKQAA